MPNLEIDINDILDGFAVENAKITRRAVLAEIGSQARDRRIDDLSAELALAKQRIEQLEDRPISEKAPDAEPESDEPTIRPARSRRTS